MQFYQILSKDFLEKFVGGRTQEETTNVTKINFMKWEFTYWLQTAMENII